MESTISSRLLSAVASSTPSSANRCALPARGGRAAPSFEPDMDPDDIISAGRRAGRGEGAREPRRRTSQRSNLAKAQFCSRCAPGCWRFSLRSTPSTSSWMCPRPPRMQRPATCSSFVRSATRMRPRFFIPSHVAQPAHVAVFCDSVRRSCILGRACGRRSATSASTALRCPRCRTSAWRRRARTWPRP